MTTETSPLLGSEQPLHRISHYATTSRFISYQAVSLLSAVDGLIGVGVAGKEWAAKQVIAISQGGAIVYNDGWWAAFLLWAAGNVAGLICVSQTTDSIYPETEAAFHVTTGCRIRRDDAASFSLRD